MKIQLPDGVNSLQDLKSLTGEVQQYARWYSQYSVKAKVTTVKSAPPPAVSPAAGSLIKAWAAAEPSVKSLDELIRTLQDLAANSPRVTITLVAPAPVSLQKTLVNWCRDNIDPNILASFKFNSTILGGLVVQHGSHVYDWSFRRQILESSQKFSQVLRHV